MTDARLRATSRAAAQGDLAARARLLLERVRAGELSSGRLQLAVWLGDDRARAAVGLDAVRPQPEQLLPWLLCLIDVGTRESVVRALASVATAQIAKGASSPATERALSIVRLWMEQPVGDAVLAREARRLASAAGRRSRPGASPVLLCAWAAQLAGSPVDRWGHLARRRFTRWAEIASEDPRPTIRLALLPWALGE